MRWDNVIVSQRNYDGRNNTTMLHVALVVGSGPFPVDYPIGDNIWLWVWLPLASAAIVTVELVLVSVRSRGSGKRPWRRPVTGVPLILACGMAIESGIEWSGYRVRAIDIITDFGPGYGEAYSTLRQLAQLDFVIVLVVTLWVMLYLMNSVPDTGK